MSTVLPSGPKKEKTEESSGLRTTPTLRAVHPRYRALFFTCPHCGVASTQWWIDLYRIDTTLKDGRRIEVSTKFDDLAMSRCNACDGRALWFEKQLLYPENSDAPPVSPDMPAELRRDYEEAAAIFSKSPRAAAALLRMCVEGLIKKITEKDTFDKAIVALQARGIPPQIQLALDVIRQNGNEVLHAGQLYGEDNEATVAMLFKLVNSVVTWAITEQRQLQELYEQIPEDKRQRLEKRRAEDAAKK